MFYACFNAMTLLFMIGYKNNPNGDTYNQTKSKMAGIFTQKDIEALLPDFSPLEASEFALSGDSLAGVPSAGGALAGGALACGISAVVTLAGRATSGGASAG